MKDIKKIAIFCMVGWGELGNLLTATNLKNALKKINICADIDLIKTNELVPIFQEIGENIKKSVLTSSTPEELFQSYSSIMDKYNNIYLNMIESNDYQKFLNHAKKLIDYIYSNKPEVIFCTKGVISRICTKVCKEIGYSPLIINYVSNHEHFQFPIHHTPNVNFHMVRTNEAYDYFLKLEVYPKEKIFLLGYIFPTVEIDKNVFSKDFFQNLKKNCFTAIIVSNRGSSLYYELLHKLSKHAKEVNVIFISLNDDELYEKANKLTKQRSISNWYVMKNLTQEQYFSLLSPNNCIPNQILITKASPNSIYEALNLNIPMLLHRSGLPMEDWAVEVVRKYSLGIVYDDISHLISKIIDDIFDGTSIEVFKENSKKYKAILISQSQLLMKLKNFLIEHALSTESTIT